MKRILIIGATSAIAEATARLYAAEGAKLFLIARDAQKLQALAADLSTRGSAEVLTAEMDANDYDQHAAVITQADAALGGIDFALIAHGTLPDQAACENSFALTRQEFETNCLSTLSLLTHLANLLELRGAGTLAVITSVAGDRGRQSNYVYGAAKGAVTLFMQGLRNRLFKQGVHVLTIKPGFVDTPMTVHLAKGMLWASPDDIATGIVKAVDKKQNVVYLPSWWRIIMTIITTIPESLFKRMRL